MTLPNTLNIRDSTPLPTGACNGPPVSSTDHAASETLRGRQRDPTHMTRIALLQHFDDDLFFLPRAQHGIDRRQMLIEAHVHDTTADRDDHAGITGTGLTVHG